MKILIPVLFLLISINASAFQSEEDTIPAEAKPIRFSKKQLASESYESVGVFDVNNDQVLDIVSGGFWYEGPDFRVRHSVGEAERYGEYYDDFSTIPLDVNGDGYMDFITGGWFGKELIWKENPGNKADASGGWRTHLIATVGNIESTRAWDLDGDGVSEIVPNTPKDSLVIYRLVLNSQGKGTGEFKAYGISDEQGHGIGFGDVNGDNRGDLITPSGWLEAPEKPFEDSWRFHPDFELGTASVPILVVDVNQDGRFDLISGQGHDYGLHWYEQPSKKMNPPEKWRKHPIDLYNSQYHSMAWEDLDGDGIGELITGKRYRAHNGKDPGGNDDIGLYYFRWNGENFSKQVIDYGPYGKGKGTGVYFSIADLDENGRKDVIVAGKDGLTVYFNEGGQ